jgi:hypothetical protein
MKKLFVLTSILALGGLSTFAQGYVNANTGGSLGAALVEVQDTTQVLNSGVAVKIGTPATAKGFTDAGPGLVNYSFYAAANGTSTAVLESAASLIATGANPTGTAAGSQGVFNIGQGLQLPTQAGFDGTALVEFAVYGVTSDGKYGGWSTVATQQPITAAAEGNSGTPTVLWGTGAGYLNTLVLVATPEPATIALGGLGAAALLLFRRRK